MPGRLNRWIPQAHEAHLFHEIYIDETSQNDHAFLVLGGVMIPHAMFRKFEADILEARKPRLRSLNSKGELREIKWSMVTTGDYEAYQKVLDSYFSFPHRHMRGSHHGAFKFFCSIVSLRVPGRQYSKGKRGQIGFNREIFFHCMSIGRRERRWLFHVYPDHRSTTQSLDKMAFKLSRAIAREHDRRDHTFRRVRFRFSHDSQALQVSDILIGAVAYRLNRHYDKPNANSDKKRLCDYVLAKTGFAKFIHESGFREKPFGTYQLWFRRHKS